MGNIYSVLANSYQTAALNSSSSKPYVNVDPAAYEGSWAGTLSNGKTFKIAIDNVQGFRAQVRYQSGAVSQSQTVLIRDNAFRIGDTKFALNANGTATVKSVVTDPVYGQSTMYAGVAKRD